MNDTKRVFFLGDEWLYYKITGKSTTLETLLLEEIDPLIKRLIKKKFISSYFFIRYVNENDELRIRLKLTGNNNLLYVISDFNKIITYNLNNRIIISATADPYSRELDRYGADIIEYVEDIFFIDSVVTLHSLQKYAETQNLSNRWIIGVNKILFLLDIFFNSNYEKIELLEKAFSYHMNSLNLSEKTIPSFDSKYRSFNKEINQNWRIYDFFPNKKYEARYISVLNELKDLKNKKKLLKDFDTILTSIMHMSINRLFAGNSNASEMIIYYFLLKKLRSEEAIKKKNLNVDIHP